MKDVPNWAVRLNTGERISFDALSDANNFRYKMKEIPTTIEANLGRPLWEILEEALLEFDSPNLVKDFCRSVGYNPSSSYVRDVRARLMKEGKLKPIRTPAPKRDQEPKAIRFRDRKPVRNAVKTVVENFSLEDLEAAASLVQKMGSAGAVIAAVQVIAKLRGEES